MVDSTGMQVAKFARRTLSRCSAPGFPHGAVLLTSFICSEGWYVFVITCLGTTFVLRETLLRRSEESTGTPDSPLFGAYGLGRPTGGAEAKHTNVDVDIFPELASSEHPARSLMWGGHTASQAHDPENTPSDSPFSSPGNLDTSVSRLVPMDLAQLNVATESERNLQLPPDVVRANTIIPS